MSLAHAVPASGSTRAVAVLSLLKIFNALVPKDAGSRKIGRSIPFGDGPRQRLDVYGPRSFGGALPVVFFIYGGSWSDGDRRNYDFAGRAIAALGYVTVIADYRLLPEIEYPVFVEDCGTAFNWVTQNISRYGGDPARVGLMGHSAGAYNAVMLALHPRYRRAMTSPDSLRCVVGLSGPYDFFPFDGDISRRTFGAARDPEDTQPINHATPGSPPMLLATGDKDQLVSPRNTVALAARLNRAKVAVTEVHYPELGHPQILLALSRPGRRLAPVLADVEVFLSANLRVDSRQEMVG
ncbi:alpha/beta hydrolase [Nostoc sp. 3335mG]|nr:alpha/beta hydrolase [Nostoc sp. 3335mG]